MFLDISSFVRVCVHKDKDNFLYMLTKSTVGFF